MNTTVEVLNASSVCIGALIGALGVVYDFKDKSGRITAWGRCAITSIVATGIIAITTQVIKIRTDTADEKIAAEKAEQVNELERRIHNPLGRFVSSIELDIPKQRLDGASGADLREKIAKLTIKVAVARATIPDNHEELLPASLKFELTPFEEAQPPFLLPRRNAPATLIKDSGRFYHLELRNLVPVVDHLSPEITGWSDLDAARIYVGLDGLGPAAEDGKKDDLYVIRHFSLRNERGMEHVLNQRDFLIFKFRDRFDYSPNSGERFPVRDEHDYMGHFPGPEPLE